MPHDTLKGRRKRGLSPEKAGKMMHEGMANGKPLSKSQRGYFGVIASGKTPEKAHEQMKRKGRRRMKGKY